MIGFLRRLFGIWPSRDDAWQPTGIKKPIGQGYDYQAARSAFMRSRGQSASGRPFAGQRGTVQPFRKVK